MREKTHSSPPPEQLAAVKRYRRIEDLIPDHWTEGNIQANGIRHHYYHSRGEKPLLVLLHGFQESALCWLPVARVLEQDYDLVLIDARGHGRSDRINGHFSPEVLSEDAAGAFRALKLDRPMVLGFSMGGTTAIRLAATHPDLVRAILVAGTSDQRPDGQVFIQSEGYQAWLQSWIVRLERLKTQSHEEQVLANLARLSTGTPLPAEDELVPMVDASAHVDLDMVRLGNELWSQVGAQYDETMTMLQRVTCPALLMYSSSFPVPNAPQTLREEPSEQANVTIVRFENAGHMIYRDRFEQFSEVVKTFLSRHMPAIS
jgi:N-formylmaleamate deformylase